MSSGLGVSVRAPGSRPGVSMRFGVGRMAIRPGTLCYFRGMTAGGWRLNGGCMGLVLDPAPAPDRGGRRHASKKLTRGACTASRPSANQSALVDDASLSCLLAPFSLVLLPRLRPALLFPAPACSLCLPLVAALGPARPTVCARIAEPPRWTSPACARFCLGFFLCPFLSSPFFCLSSAPRDTTVNGRDTR